MLEQDVTRPLSAFGAWFLAAAYGEEALARFEAALPAAAAATASALS